MIGHPADAQQRRRPHVVKDHREHSDGPRDREDRQLDLDETRQHQRPPVSSGAGPGFRAPCRRTRRIGVAAASEREAAPRQAAGPGWRRGRHANCERIVGVLLVIRFPWRRHQRRMQLTPAGAQQECSLESGNREIDPDEYVYVVPPDGSVDQVLAVRERGQRVRDGFVEIRSDVCQRTDRRLQVLQVFHQVGLGVVDEPGGGVAEDTQFVECFGDARPLPDQHLQRGR